MQVNVNLGLRLAGSAARSRCARALSLVALAAVLAVGIPAWAESTRIPLPAPPQSVPAVGLPGPAEENDHVPGAVGDAEVVRVGIGRDGSVSSVVVDQTLTLSGVGDFSFHVP